MIKVEEGHLRFVLHEMIAAGRGEGVGYRQDDGNFVALSPEQYAEYHLQRLKGEAE